MKDDPTSAASIEAALNALIEQLDRRGGVEGDVDEVGLRAVESLAAAAPASLEPESQARVKRLYALALSKLAQRRSEVGTEIARVREARSLLASRARSTAGPSVSAGGDCDMAG